MTRINSTRQAFVLSKISEILCGLGIIHAFGKQESGLRVIFDTIDKWTQTSLPNQLAKEMLSMQVSTVSSIVVLSAATAVASSRNAISPSLAGLCLTWSLVYFSQVSAQLNSHMIFDEWIKDYISEIASEKHNLYRENDTFLRNTEWPQRGHIEMKHISMRYMPHSPIVLRNLSVTFQAGKKVGIVGRTGARKSSILMWYFELWRYHRVR